MEEVNLPSPKSRPSFVEKAMSSLFSRQLWFIKRYNKIIRKRQDRDSSQVIGQNHHIFPVSLYGTPKTNKWTVKLSHREHFIVHRILARLCEIRYGMNHQKTKKMQWALVYMLGRLEIKNNSRMYAICVEAARKAIKNRKYTPEQRQNLSCRMKGTNNPMYGTKQSPENKLRMRLVNLGHKNNLGKRHKEETKRKIAESVRSYHQNLKMQSI